MWETRISAALSEGGWGGGVSGMSRSCTELPRGVVEAALALLSADVGVPDGFAPGPGGGSLVRLQAASTSQHASGKRVRREAMGGVLAKREAGANSRVFRDRPRARTD